MTDYQTTVNIASSPEIPIEHKALLTSSEIAQLWGTYMNYSMLTCFFRYFEKVAQEQSIKELMAETLSRCEKRVSFVVNAFQNENIPIPMGFSDSDVNLSAPLLFSEVFMLHYLRNMIRTGMTINSLNINMATRPDIRDFFSTSLESSILLNTKLTDLMLSKGILPKPPYVTVSQETEYVHKPEFLTGFMGEKRPLLTIEIAHLYHNALVNEIGRTLLLGFRQVCTDKEVKDYFSRGIKTCDIIVETLTKLARKEHIIFSFIRDANVSDSTVAPFSDSLMMYHIFLLNTIGAGMYGVSGAVSGRHDIMKIYGQFLVEVGLYAEAGAKIMIKNDWLEEPPQILDRDELAKLKH